MTTPAPEPYGPLTLYQMIGQFEDYCRAARTGDAQLANMLAHCFPTFPETLEKVGRP